MKKLTLISLLILLISSFVFSQVAINNDGGTPDGSAMLDVKSYNKGFLPPRMTHAEINAIASPANGLIVYCTDCGPGGTGTLSMFMSGFWFSLSATNMDLVVTTTPLSSITSSTAMCGGNVVIYGGATVTGRGVCWSTTQNPTIANPKTTDGAGTGTFTSSITGCLPGTTYYVRAYATTSFGTVYGNELILQLNASQSPYFNYFRYNDVQTAGMVSYQSIDPVSKVTIDNVGVVTVPYATWGPLANFTFKYDITIRDQSGTIAKVEILNGATVLDRKLDGLTTGSFTIPKSSSYTSLTVKVTDGYSNVASLSLNTVFTLPLGVQISSVRLSTSSGGSALTTPEGTGSAATPWLIARTGADLSYYLNWTMTKNNDANVTNINFTGSPTLSNLTGASLVQQTISPVVLPNSDAATVYRLGVSAKGDVAQVYSGISYSAYYQLRDKLYCGFLPSNVKPTEAQILALQKSSLSTTEYYSTRINPVPPDASESGITLVNSTGASGFFAWAVPTYSNGATAPASFSKYTYAFAFGSWNPYDEGFDRTSYFVKTSGANATWYWVCIYNSSFINGGQIRALLQN